MPKNRDTAFLQKRLDEFRADYVICSPSWFEKAETLPASLIPVEEWRLDHNAICGSSVVFFYGTTPAAALRMRNSLDEYHSSVSPDPTPLHKVTPLDKTEAASRP
jgi:hypothetical protein